ncbi:5-methyltetrahydropteroyltriglutamate--homocysteine S-methyltransferase [Celerinatantimonas diazotrophica]|uniref:5-methyltetrahydropteroyltriglutamate--homocysteine methyltransferase n=1 Tax=Celerinatantimonas diazotrophica TaxID=412034 RepID=A0A4R1K460_9GAMM|nr:5-methyltetrahydropteroyltriglutamate--homocysteine S-methyltransferase [Celerinatantimonas diazotrophica]TCK58700.1 methionine synthase (B12-independent) [Celerinatantimonas diazotrophica]CAG9297329.1 5-methyltetrahydropteroyltriglutamate--homocysteine methyltransferase [Celerinatantimonas diazotrophica]
MATLHNLGYPRIGEDRELKRAIEKFWQGKIDEDELKNIGQQLRRQNYQTQQSAGIDLLPVGDFAWYDHILQLALTFGAVPSRHRGSGNSSELTKLFSLARGHSDEQGNHAALEMTKWFDTNYHYLVPEFEAEQQFELGHSPLLEQIDEANAQSLPVKAVLTGPLTFLYLGRFEGQQKLSLLPALLKGYQQLLAKIADKGIDWVQIDEPILALELDPVWQQAFADTYQQLGQNPVQLLLTSYFGSLSIPLSDIAQWPVSGIHLDLVRAPWQLEGAVNEWPTDKVLSLGVIDGRNIWRSDLDYWFDILQPVNQVRGDRLWLAPSCSLLHVPVNLEREGKLDAELKNWLSFAKQKLSELVALGHQLDNEVSEKDRHYLSLSRQVVVSRNQSLRINNPAVRARVDGLTEDDFHRSSEYAERAKIQRQSLKLPLLPTTTIGSFPQTSDIRATRSAFVKGDITQTEYDVFIAEQIDEVIQRQEQLGLDVLVHGEPERNDMVEYFAPYLRGVEQTQYGWVQSYGTRCVKPPIIYGDVCRAEPMTIHWSTYAQSRSNKPVKGMLTGPQTILGWSFVRSDIPRADVAEQIALALRDEVDDLQKAGISIIQIDEPALREGLPLKQSQWPEYLNRAVRAFRLCASVADDATQIHTHMCYSQFNDIIASIAQMDADVITIETSRSAMKLLDAFQDFNYPNEIGPGVYDIHSPVVPSSQWIEKLLVLASEKIPLERLWVNPDCGLKTRDWPETLAALQVMVDVARKLRDKFKNTIN